MLTLVIAPAIDSDRLHRLQAAVPEVACINCRDHAQAIAMMPLADGFYGKLTPELLDLAPQLRWVQAPTASLEHYIFPELIAHPCQLSNMRGLFSDVIADHVLGLVLCFARNLHHYIRQQASGRWAPVGNPNAVTEFVSSPGTVSSVDRAHQHLADMTLGVFGVGAIGAEICRRARAFGMSVRGVDPAVRSIPDLDLAIESLESFPQLLHGSDYLVIAAPQTPQTTGAFHRDVFRQMKPTAVLINIGRGAIVRLDDLATALQTGVLGGAALDVCEREPLPADHPLWTMPNVIITPHVAAASPRIAERHFATLVANVRCFSRHEPPTTLVDKRAWY